MPSFLDADDIIEISEKRLKQYSESYQKITDKFTNIFIIYSAISIFLVPCIDTLFFTTPQSWIFHSCFYLFSVLFFISVSFTILLLIPTEVAYLVEPKVYYADYLLQYRANGMTDAEAEKYLKGSYINELEQAIATNDKLFKKKSKYYYNALLFVLIASLPYLVCLGFHFSKDSKTQKIEIVNPQKVCNFDENFNDMAKDKNAKTVTTTQVPGLDSAKIIPSKPQLIKEGSDKDINHPHKKG